MGAGFSQLDPELAAAARALVDAAAAARLQPRVTSTYRSHAEQTRLYRRFLAGQQGYPVAPPGFSAHEYGWAFDMVVSPMDALADVGYTWQQWGGAWNPGDAVHFELPGASAEAERLGKEAVAKLASPPWWWEYATWLFPVKSLDVTGGLPIQNTQQYTDCILNTRLPASECRRRAGASY